MLEKQVLEAEKQISIFNSFSKIEHSFLAYGFNCSDQSIYMLEKV